MSDKWNKYFEKQATEDMKATSSAKPNGDEKPDEAEKAGENAEKERRKVCDCGTARGCGKEERKCEDSGIRVCVVRG